jgi:hypothetical protein
MSGDNWSHGAVEYWSDGIGSVVNLDWVPIQSPRVDCLKLVALH